MKLMPAFNERNVPIVFSANNEFVPPLSVMIKSIVNCSHENNNYDLFVLHSSIDDDNQKRMQTLVESHENFSLRFVDLTHRLEGFTFFTESPNTITQETYYRLAIPEDFAAFEKVIYLDGDMIARHDVADLLKYDLGSNLLASSRDYWGNCSYYKPTGGETVTRYRNSLGLKDIDDYFIAGMLVFNISEWNESFTTRDLFEFATSRNWVQHDQDVLNVLASGRTLILPCKWDYMADKYDEMKYLPEKFQEDLEEGKRERYIIHYGGSRKPWKFKYQEYGDCFWKVACETPFFEELIGGSKKLGAGYKSYILRTFTESGVVPTVKGKDVVFRTTAGTWVGKVSRIPVNIEFIDYADDKLIIQVHIFQNVLPDIESLPLNVKVGETTIAAQRMSQLVSRKKWDKVVEKAASFLVEIPIATFAKKYQRVRYFTECCSVPIELKKLTFSKHCPIGKSIRSCYWRFDRYALLWSEEKGLGVRRFEPFYFAKRWLLRNCQVLRQYGFQALLFRFAKRSGQGGKRIWLFSDRTNKAGDNGEALYRYVQTSHSDEIDSYFVLKKDAPDYARLKSSGAKVIDFMSFKHLWLHLKAEFNISSQADRVSFNPFGKYESAVLDKVHDTRFVFLQHGVIRSDISGWFNRVNINPALFCTSARAEYDSILSNPSYCMDEDTLQLTGLPRHDLLDREDTRTITLMPTWRQYLCERNDSDKGVWHVRQGFTASLYYRKYNELFNNSRLLDAAEAYGYKIKVFVHPNMVSAIDLFDHDERVDYLDISTSYRDAISKSSLVLTDYSSAVFDFLYLRKPVVYCSLDSDEMVGKHHVSFKSPLEYDRSFGEIAYSVESLVDILIGYMSDECKMKPKYLDRVNKFFEYADKNNCERVYNAIIALRD